MRSCGCRRLLDWLRIHFVFSKTVIFIWGLVLSHSLVEYAIVSVLMDYLPVILEQPSLRVSAMVVNLLDGVSAVLVVIFTHISEAYTGRFNMIVFSTSSYVMGLMLLWVTGWSYTEFNMFYIALPLIALGKAGKLPTLRAFLEYQLSEKVKKRAENNRKFENVGNESEEERNEISTSIWWRTAWISGATIAVFWLGEISWLMTFKISALFMGTMYLLFYSGFICYYPEEKPTGSSLTTIYKVFMAAFWKLNLNYPHSEESYYWKNHTPMPNHFARRQDGEVRLLPPVPSLLTFLDKAAIVGNHSEVERDEKNGNLCTVEEVRKVKSLYPVLPLAPTFFAYCLVAASGNTYFIAQGSNLNFSIGRGFKIPFSFFFVMKSFIRDGVTFLFWRFELRNQRSTKWRIGFGMFCAVLCCIAAWQVELRRLTLIKEEGVLQNPEKIIHMSIMVLTPQFFLLGLMEGFADNGLAKFFYNHVPKSMREFEFGEMVLGIGKFFSIPFVLIFRSWFNESINTSHLDKYFLTLAIMTFGFFWIYVFYACRYTLLQYDELDAEGQTLEALQEAVQEESDLVPATSTIPN